MVDVVPSEYTLTINVSWRFLSPSSVVIDTELHERLSLKFSFNKIAGVPMHCVHTVVCLYLFQKGRL